MNRERDYWPVLYAALLALAFVGYPLVSGVGSVLGFNSRGLSIALRACVGAASLAMLFTTLVRNQSRYLRDPRLTIFLLVWCALLFRFVWDASIVPIPMDLPWFENTLMIVGAVLIPALALAHVPTTGSLHSARRVMLVVGTAAASLSVVAVARVLLSEDKLEALGRLGTDTLNPISVGQLGVLLVITGVLANPVGAQSRVVRAIDSWPSRWLTCLFGVALVIVSGSKGPVLALVSVVLTAQIGHTLRRHGLRRLIVSLALTGVAGALLLLLAVFLGDTFGLGIVDRFVNIGADPSTLDRLGLISRALQQFEHSPWTGDSFVELQTRFYPHNVFVEMMMATGVLGFCGLLAMVVFSASSALRLLKSSHSWLALIYVQGFISAMLSGSVYFDPGFWCITLAIIGADRLTNGLGGTGSASPAVLRSTPLQQEPT